MHALLRGIIAISAGGCVAGVLVWLVLFLLGRSGVHHLESAQTWPAQK